MGVSSLVIVLHLTELIKLCLTRKQHSETLGRRPWLKQRNWPQYNDLACSPLLFPWVWGMIVMTTNPDVLLIDLLAPRNEQGKPVTSPPNVKVVAPKEGKVKSSYFSVLGYTTIGDKYIDPDRKIRLQEMEENKPFVSDDKKNFVPPSGYKELVGGLYPHDADFELPKGPNNHKDSDGRVVVGPKNVTTNPASKLLAQFPKHEKDEYNRYHQFEREKIFHEQKILKDK